MNDHRITTEAELEAVMGTPAEAVRAKILPRLDDVMTEFVRRAPLVFLSTIDADGHVDVSPKGDAPGFVHIDGAGCLLIPDRPGNRLTMGFRNILRSGEIGLIFVIPNQRETLRVKGTATLQRDPALLAELQANGKPALLCTRVEISGCFMHCGKAFIRSRLWQPESWEAPGRSLGARQFASVFGGDDPATAVQRTEDLLEKAYTDELY